MQHAEIKFIYIFWPFFNELIQNDINQIATCDCEMEYFKFSTHNINCYLIISRFVSVSFSVMKDHLHIINNTQE